MYELLQTQEINKFTNLVINFICNIKMIVESTFMQKCGQGTPMFSRRGKSTSVQYLVFNDEKPNAESTFTKIKKEQDFIE
jgi:hypothetical protein